MVDDNRSPLAILLSAYACEPGLGSEQAVGWGWVTGLADRQKSVCVITRESNRRRIEAWLATNPMPNVRFVYFDLPRFARWLKKKPGFGYLYYVAWQYGAYRVARQLLRTEKFDLVHHVTFVTARLTSFMGSLGIPFVFGPVAGGEYAPFQAWRNFPIKDQAYELVRYLSMRWVQYSPLMKLCFDRASLIVCTSKDTLACIPNRYHYKCRELLAITYDEVLPNVSKEVLDEHAPLRLVFAGRAIEWKGFRFALAAINALRQKGILFELTVIASGPRLAAWKTDVARRGMEQSVKFVGGLERSAFLDELGRFDLMVFPSLHDSGGMVVLEAMAAGVPVICLKVGGPGQIVDVSCGVAVDVGNEEQIIQRFSEAIELLAKDSGLRQRLGAAAVKRVACNYRLASKIAAMEGMYIEALRAAR